MYEGWKSDTGKRSVLSEKTVYAGVESSEDFHEKWESKIQSIYDPPKIGVRVLNGDGGSWIYDDSICANGEHETEEEKAKELK